MAAQGSLEQGHLYDRWRHPDGTEVLLPSTNREAYARAGLSLVAEEDFDYEQQRAADADAARWRGTSQDVNPSETGPTAPFPAA